MANKVVIDGNQAGLLNTNYNNIGTEGLFMVVFPTAKDKNTTLEFEYWVDRFDDSMLDRIWTKNYRDSFGIWSLIIFIITVVCIICCCLCGCFILWKYFCRKHQIRGYQLEDGTSTTQVQVFQQAEMTTQVRDNTDEMDYNHPNLAYNMDNRNGHFEDDEKYEKKDKKKKKNKKSSKY